MRTGSGTDREPDTLGDRESQGGVRERRGMEEERWRESEKGEER